MEQGAVRGLLWCGVGRGRFKDDFLGGAFRVVKGCVWSV